MDIKQYLLIIGVPAVLGCIFKFVKDNRVKTYKRAIMWGEWLSFMIRKGLHVIIIRLPIISKHAKDIENGIEYTIIDSFDGIKVGLRLDNKVNLKAIKELLKKVNESKIDKVKQSDGDVEKLKNI